MVDAVVSFVVERLGDFLIQEAEFLGGVKNKVMWLKDELGWMQCYIANAEEEQIDNPMIRKWLSDITEISYEIEDVLDKFILQEKPGSFISSLIKGKLFGTGKKIEEFQIRINDLSRRRELYGLRALDDKEGESNSTTLGKFKQLRRATSFTVDEKIIGFEDEANSLLAKLLDEEPRRSVISIYGMGGLGKTTLAKKLYHSQVVKMKFIRRAWVSVSQDYNTRDLLVRIIHSFGIKSKKTEELKDMPEEELERYLNGYLRGRLYLVVIDDVWQKEAWECLKRAFPDSNNGSRVIITTRIREVAERSNERTHAHKLRFLRLDESWQLFCEKTFGNSDINDADAELKALGIEMVQKCNGLPLAIVVLGGLLSTKSKLREWKLVFKSAQYFDGCDGRFPMDLYEGIGKLVCLKHLGFRKSGFSKLPSSILNLRRLQTLDVFSRVTDLFTIGRATEIELPEKVYKLQELRHLVGLFTGPLKIDSLTKLQSLKLVNSKSWSKINPEKLVNLRELSIYSTLCTEANVFCFDSVVKLLRLERLSVRLSSGDSFASLQPLSSCSNLIDLRLYGNLKKLPEDIDVVLPNLECLLLKNSCLTDDPMPLLGKLPSLMILCLDFNFYCGKKLMCSALSFPRLEIIKLSRDDQLEEWQVEEGAMPRLRGLSMPQNSRLRIPERLRSIPHPAESEFETGELDLLV
ncbi:hypothetical protein LWI29_023965 [Acer saccharum]|uniref:Uncharacterized protein n=1 Tax=Acer saccharum TaxID=4024 RepID=A0AA39W503_ACESA|nr:hypothetical protein LWI29_023965 [Acer saccharum]